MKRLVLGCLLLLLLAIPPAMAQAPLVAALNSDVPTLDPTMDSSPIALHLRLNVFDQLTQIDRDGTIKPRLATAWEPAENNAVWTFTIRKTAKFHDGTPVTIDDVIWTYEKILADAKSPVRTYVGKVSGIDRLADDKLRFRLPEPNATFARQVALISIVPRKGYEQIGQDRFGQAPIGSGPYKVLRWVKDDRIELEAFADYWAGAPSVKLATFRPVPSEASRSSALLSGELDIVPALPAALVDRLSSRPGIRVEKAPGYRVIYLGFNVKNAPLDDLKLRLAVDHAIDREAISNRLLRGMGKPSGQMVAPTTFGYDPSIQPTTYDVAKAKQLLKESGYKGQKIPLHYPTNNLASSNEVAQAVLGYLNEIGVNVEMQGLDYTGFFALWRELKLPGIHLFGYGPVLADADSPLTGLYQSGERGYWTSTEVDDLIKRQRGETDDAKRKALIAQVWRISKENAPYVPLYNELQAYGLRDGVSWTPRPDGIMRLDTITKR